jgi:hypothetical protein
MKKCFTLTADYRYDLVQDENGEITMWGIKYRQEKIPTN